TKQSFQPSLIFLGVTEQSRFDQMLAERFAHMEPQMPHPSPVLSWLTVVLDPLDQCDVQPHFGDRRIKARIARDEMRQVFVSKNKVGKESTVQRVRCPLMYPANFMCLVDGGRTIVLRLVVVGHSQRCWSANKRKQAIARKYRFY